MHGIRVDRIVLVQRVGLDEVHTEEVMPTPTPVGLWGRLWKAEYLT